ncbi:Gluconolaconase [Sphingomonas sp. EC-HK361]|uniref:SMP-30/gluconolactonase/LRE family protein n=1 Tax=Sphingomonas sp. EC-HK361 TaxID=2038397 RepID=UPI00125AF4A1|nr:SMP-30/gluconolactonase/LRE family protein [Sphingomonas sp. EC-HK361]VVT15100.1 Gluconolaconase [Sphingomonas sp. EC-HK361]
MAPARIIARDRRDTLGEGPLWSPRDQSIYWVDILGRRLNRLALADDRVDSWEMPDTISWVIERSDAPGFIAGIGRRFVELQLDPVTITPIAAPEEDRDGNRFNDAKADVAGRIWAGSMPFSCDRPTGAFHRLDPDRSVTRVDDGYTIANGPAIASDGRALYHTDTALGTIYRYRIAADGTLNDREPFIVFEADWGSPDGMTLDADGGLWVACWGGSCVRRFTPDGAFDRSIALPASQITSCTFAGDALDRMFVTSAADGVDEPHGGALFEVDPGCRGLPTHRYQG